MATTAEQEFYKETLFCLEMLCCLNKIFNEKHTYVLIKKPLARTRKRPRKGQK